MDELANAIKSVVREEIARQYREDERGKCPAGAHFYEEDISPWLIARAVIPIVLEAAARQADAYAEIWEAPSLTIAATIRALASGDGKG